MVSRTLLTAVLLMFAFATPASARVGIDGPTYQRAAGSCTTVGGGRIVALPGAPGERIDRRLLADVTYLLNRFPVRITDAHARAGHNPAGEHPLGLAVDVVPDRKAGGRWRDVAALAKFAEPHAGKPRAPFGFVGYTGDAGFGRGRHLHLSWQHSAATKDGLAVSVRSLKCAAIAHAA